MADIKEDANSLVGSKDNKLLRDPVYGYISIPSYIFDTIIDKACFQRLRFIRQTSYAPVYSAALHNRFIHSIGVYHLGCIAYDAFYSSVVSLDLQNTAHTIDWGRMRHIFTTACLLHDLGHAPFSHSGEDFFAKNSPMPHMQLIDEVASDTFSKDAKQFKGNGQEAAQHELMSAYVALKSFPELFADSDEKELFARCITGYLYSPVDKNTKLPTELALKNCLISLLNSSIIDVDRMDYVMRDSYVSGFQNMSIDYKRLLNSISIAPKNGTYQLAYHKSAISVIESVIFAHDTERKWMQSHPVVMYEHFLIQHAISIVEQYYSSLQPKLEDAECTLPSFFSFESLTESGNQFRPDLCISLLSDDDIIYSIKNIPACQDELTKEYFSRTERRHAVWKSEAEYRALFERVLGPDKLNELEELFGLIENYFTNNVFTSDDPQLPVINSNFLAYCREQYTSFQEIAKKDPQISQPQMDFFERVIPMLTAIEAYMTENDLLFDFVIVKAKRFRSTFGKKDIDNILVSFPKFKNAYYIRDILTLFRTDSERDKFFYLFYHRKNMQGEKVLKKIDALSFSKVLCRNIM